MTNPHENGAGHHKRSFGASQETCEIVWSSVIQKRELAGKMAAEYVSVGILIEVRTYKNTKTTLQAQSSHG